MLAYNFGDTIVAVSTPPGNSSLGIVRLSGPEALPLAQGIFNPAANSGSPAKSRERGAAAGLAEWQAADGTALAVPASLWQMPAPRSYTGEDVAELLLPGAAVLLGMLTDELVRRGGRRAAAGEFTWRAFFHGRLTLGEVRAVAALISNADQYARQAAVEVLRCGTAGKIAAWREELHHCAALIEAELDFSEEDTDPEFFTVLGGRLEKLMASGGKTLAAASRRLGHGEGLPVGLVGLTNAGKSSLFNLLLGRDAAIAAAEKSTTRDRLTRSLAIDGCRFLLTDCPGFDNSPGDIPALLREHNDDGGFALRLAVVDSCAVAPGELAAVTSFFRKLTPGRVVPVYNKCDDGQTPPAEVAAAVNAGLAAAPGVETAAAVYVSARTGAGADDLRSALLAAANDDCGAGTAGGNDCEIAALAAAREILSRACGHLAAENLEFAAFEIRTACQTLSRLSGDTYSEEVLSSVFANFCIGK